MARVRVTTEDQQQWIVAGDRPIPDEERAKFGAGELTSAFRMREPGDATTPQLVEIRYQPDAEIGTHAHDEDEIIYVVEGTLRINNRVLGPGSCLTIPGGVFYGFHAGPEGLRILNFRPRADTSFRVPGRAGER